MRRVAPLSLALLALAAGCSSSPSPAAAPPISPRAPHAAAAGAPAPILPEAAARVSFERLARYPEPGWHVPRSLHFAPDGSMATFLASESQSDRMALFAVDVATGAVRVLVRAEDLPQRKGEMSQEEQLRRERTRSRLEGITEVVWAERANVLVIPSAGDVVVRTADGALRRLTETAAPEIDPRPCPTGERVAYVRDADLFVTDLATGQERRLTRGGPPRTTRGLTDFVAQEEFGETSGYFWAPDCRSIAYLEVDERGVDTIPVLGYRKDGDAVHMEQRYPRAGRPNPRVQLRLVDVDGRRDREVKLHASIGAEPYLLRFTWADDGRALWLQALPRDQRTRHLVRVDPATATARSVTRHGSRSWVEPSALLLTPDGRSACWIEPGRETGDDVVATIDLETGTRTLLRGGHQVFDLHGLSPDGSTLYATTNRDFVLGRQLDAIPLHGDAPVRSLTPERGVHQVEVAKDGTFVDVHSAADRLPEAALRGPDGAVKARLPVGRDDDLAALDLRLPRLVSFTHDGVELHGAVLAPRDHDPARTYPLVLMVYGGPGVQTVLDRWAPRPLWQHLADRGFFVAQFDNRGSSGRGLPFAHPIQGRLGEVELADQEAALRHVLASEPSIDAGRVAIYGHSYGGFLAAMAMLTRPGVFRAAAAGSPVTDWALYDTGYTERYMGMPAENASGYAASRLPDLAKELHGPLLLLHGFMDENVHLEHTARLTDALVAAGKPFDLVLFPSERHGYRSPVARSYANRRVVDFFVEHLGGGARQAGAGR